MYCTCQLPLPQCHAGMREIINFQFIHNRHDVTSSRAKKLAVSCMLIALHMIQMCTSTSNVPILVNCVLHISTILDSHHNNHNLRTPFQCHPQHNPRYLSNVILKSLCHHSDHCLPVYQCSVLSQEDLPRNLTQHHRRPSVGSPWGLRMLVPCSHSNNKDGQSRGFAFARFQWHEDDQKALECIEWTVLDGLILHPQWATYVGTRNAPSKPNRNGSRNKRGTKIGTNSIEESAHVNASEKWTPVGRHGHHHWWVVSVLVPDTFPSVCLLYLLFFPLKDPSSAAVSLPMLAADLPVYSGSWSTTARSRSPLLASSITGNVDKEDDKSHKWWGSMRRRILSSSSPSNPNWKNVLGVGSSNNHDKGKPPSTTPEMSSLCSLDKSAKQSVFAQHLVLSSSQASWRLKEAYSLRLQENSMCYFIPRL